MNASLFEKRNHAIDMLRGLTMLLMVFVNDLWRIDGVPHFLEHFGTHEDGMGVADVVFPMFLFAMGMSIPYAIERRFSKGYTGESTLGHILSRTFALLMMGAFTVNSEGGIASTLGYGMPVYRILMVIGFFLVWNAWPKTMKGRVWLQILGVAVLAFLAFTFRTPKGGYFTSGWWGILGLIGWSYVFCATVYLLGRRKEWTLAVVWLAIIVLNIFMTGMRDGSRLIEGRTLIGDFAGVLRLGNGSAALMTMGGMLASVLENRLSGKTPLIRTGAAVAAAAILAAGAAVSHNWWIISKNIGTLPWCLYVSSLSVTLYLLLRVLEAYGKTGWFRIINPAGTATLTVYMMPYLLYSIMSYLHLPHPEWLSGWVGLMECALFSLLCIGCAALLGRIGLKLKI